MSGDKVKTILRFLYAMVLAAGLVSGMHLTVLAQTNRSVGTAVAVPTPLPEQIDFVGLTLTDVLNREVRELNSILFMMSRVGDVNVPPQLFIRVDLNPAQRNLQEVRRLVQENINSYQNRVRGFVGDTSNFELRWTGLRTYPDGKMFVTLTQIRTFELDLTGEKPLIPATAIADLIKVDETAVKCIFSKVPGVKRFSLSRYKEEFPGFERDLRYDSSYVPQVIEVKEGGYICVPTTPDLMERLGDKQSKEFITLWGEPTQQRRYSVATGKSVALIAPRPKVFPYREDDTDKILIYIQGEPESLVRVRTSPNLMRWEEDRFIRISPGGDQELIGGAEAPNLFYSIEFAP